MKLWTKIVDFFSNKKKPTVTFTRVDLTNKIAQSISRWEGFYVDGSIAETYNNPGNLRSWGSYPVVKGYAKFPTEEIGWSALRTQVGYVIYGSNNFPRLATNPVNLYEFFAGQRDKTSGVVLRGGYPGFAPSADKNNPKTYAENVAKEVGIDPNVPIRNYIV